MHGHAKGTSLRRVLAGSVVGTALEWHDFFIYGTAAALVLGDPFFNDRAGTGVGAPAAFATLSVGFAVRPLGGILFGNMGDRIGRRETLIVTTLLLGLKKPAREALVSAPKVAREEKPMEPVAS
jgi:MFS family permease